MGLTEGHTPGGKIIGQFRRVQKACAKRTTHPRGVEGRGLKHVRHECKGVPHRPVRIEERYLVFLQIPIIGQRDALERGQKIDEVAISPPRLAPHDLRHIGILFLRHD